MYIFRNSDFKFLLYFGKEHRRLHAIYHNYSLSMDQLLNEYIHTVQITQLNWQMCATLVCKSKKHMWHQTTRVHTCKINAPHTHALIHTKYLPRNDSPYNQQCLKFYNLRMQNYSWWNSLPMYWDTQDIYISHL